MTNSTPPCLVLVNGPPGAGKTTLAPKLAEALGAICISRDAIKKFLFDGWEPTHPALREDYSSAAEVSRFNEGKVSWDIFLWAIDEVLPNHVVVAESPFNHGFARRRVAALLEQITVPVIEVFLFAPPELLLERVAKRAASEGAHVIEARFSLETAKTLLEESYDPLLADSGMLIRVDTSDFSVIDLSSVASEIRELLESTRELQSP